MKKILFISLFTIFISPLFAVDYSEMSTQELIEIMGYVKKENQKEFTKELKTRIPTMNEKENKKYKINLEKLKNK